MEKVVWKIHRIFISPEFHLALLDVLFSDFSEVNGGNNHIVRKTASIWREPYISINQPGAHINQRN